MSVASFDLSEIMEEAFERAGVEIRSGYDLRKARRCFNLLTLEWANRGFNLWTVEENTTSLVAGTASYTFSSDTVDLIDHVLRDNGSDYRITRIKLSEYASKNDKDMEGRPSQVYVQRLASSTIATLWPVPSSSSYELISWNLIAIDALASGNGSGTSPDIPARFIPALTSGLAFHVAQSYAESAPRIPFLQSEYDRQWELAAGEDRDRSTVRLVPGISRF